MCKIGDIIIINEFKNEYGKKVPKHSFVVIDDKHKKKKLKYLSTLPIKEDEIFGKILNAKNGYVKSDQLYYFDKDKIKFKVIAYMSDEFLEELNMLISKLKKKNYIKKVTTNIEKETVKN